MHTPVNVITIEREYGSHGAEFAHDLADRLGWRLLDSELVDRAARAAGINPKFAEKFDERLDPWYYRYGKIFWQDPVYTPAIGSEHSFDSERMIGLIKQQIVKEANEGNCVIVGRGAACALAGKPGCFHVFVYATASAKRDWYARTFPDRAQHAEQDLLAVDKRRSAVIRKFYQQEWCSRGLYHMLLNSCIGTESMISATMCAGRICAPVAAEAVAESSR